MKRPMKYGIAVIATVSANAQAQDAAVATIKRPDGAEAVAIYQPSNELIEWLQTFATDRGLEFEFASETRLGQASDSDMAIQSLAAELQLAIGEGANIRIVEAAEMSLASQGGGGVPTTLGK